MRVLVLGGYGLIGTAITKLLIKDGHAVTGLARSRRKGKALIPAAEWIEADIATLTQASDWREHLSDIDIVVNAAGVLQTGLSDNVVAVQRDAIIALISACETSDIGQVIQISAPKADIHSSTQFFRTKAASDHALKSSALNWVIFKPGLVLSPYAYGGTSFIRTLAAVPWIQPIMMGETLIQTVSIDDVAEAVSYAVTHNLSKLDVDLVEDTPGTLLDLTLSVRRWLGFRAPKMVLPFPKWVGRALGKCADIGGWLGWRSPIRTTALKVLENGVTGDGSPWRDASDRSIKSLGETLNDLPATLQERIYARAMLVFPVLLLTLAGFWIVSGVIGFAYHTDAVKQLDGTMPKTWAEICVRVGSFADIAIGAALLFRPTSRLACFASIALSTVYLSASAWLTPHLWADPLGPMVKVFPVMALALIVAALVEER